MKARFISLIIASLVVFLAQACAQEFVPFFSAEPALNGNGLLNNRVAFWRFEETSGNALDSSGNGHTLTQNGTVSTASGIVANARQYVDDLETDFLEQASESVYQLSGDFTITGWIDIDNAPPAIDDKAILSRGDFAGSNFSWLLLFDNATPTDKIQFYWSTDGTFNAGNVLEFDLGGEASIGDFYFVCVRRTGTTLKLSATYAGDSSLATEATTTSAGSGAFFEDGTSTLRVGDLEGSDAHDMRGIIDEVGIWSAYLSDCQLKWLFTARAGSFSFPNFDALTCADP